jgi:hypothetical protein
MAKFDLHNFIAPKRGVSPVAAAQTDNTAIVSQICDTLGYGSSEFAILTGSLADADATFAVTVHDGDAANLSDAAAVASDRTARHAALASFIFSDDDKVFKIGYMGQQALLARDDHAVCQHRQRLYRWRVHQRQADSRPDRKPARLIDGCCA